MVATSLREITIGVRDLALRIRQFEAGCGLATLRLGAMAPMSASRLFDTHGTPQAAVLGRTDVPHSPRLRLVEALAGTPARTGGLSAPGPLGIGFTTASISGVQARLADLGVQFVSPPLLLTPAPAAATLLGPPGPRRYEAFGRTVDGDFLVLIERIGATTPYGVLTTDCSEPLHASFVVTNLDASVHFMRDVLEHEVLAAEACSGPPFDALLGLPSDVSFRFAMLHQPAYPTGRIVLIEYEKKPAPMTQTPGLTPGICRLRYDTDDLHTTLSRVPGGGGSLVRGPASVDDPVLGHGLVAMVRSPYGMLIELWQTLESS